MGFIQPCFIRKNTNELARKLSDLGYYYTYYIDGSGIYCHGSLAQTFTYNNELPKECIGVKADNENLFLALAALRDDTDRNQWFTDGVHWEKINDDIPSKYMQLNGHKASVEELISYFDGRSK